MLYKIGSVLIICFALVFMAGCSRGHEKTSPPMPVPNQQTTPVTTTINPTQLPPQPTSSSITQKTSNGPISEPTSKPVRAKPTVIGSWEKESWGQELGNVWNNPGEPGIILDTTGVKYIQGEPVYAPGEPIKFQVYLKNTSSDAGKEAQVITVLEYTPTVDIMTDDKSGNQISVWKKTVPKLTGTLEKPGDAYLMEVEWSLSDMDGNLATPGHYGIFLIPGVLRYKTPDGIEHSQQLNQSLALCHLDTNIE